MKSWQSCLITHLGRPLGLQDDKDPRISIQSAHKGGPTYRPPLPRRKNRWYSLPLEAATGKIKSMKNSNNPSATFILCSLILCLYFIRTCSLSSLSCILPLLSSTYNKHPWPWLHFPPPLYFICTSLSWLSWLCLLSLLYNTYNTNIHAPGWIQTRNPSKRSATDPRLRSLGHWDRQESNARPSSRWHSTSTTTSPRTHSTSGAAHVLNDS
jgi:hypothetical protein